LVGGPPCQGFSINAPSRFLTDPRNRLFKEYARFVAEFEPKTFLFENVPGLLSLGSGAVAKQILKELMALGYDVSMRILFAAHYGVPQERWRLIILGSRVGEAPMHPVPTHNAVGRANFTGGRTLTFKVDELTAADLVPHVTVKDAIGDLPVLESGTGSEEMPYTKPPCSDYARDSRQGSNAVYNHVAPKIAPINLARLQYIRPGGSWRDIPYELLPSGMKRAKTSDHTRRYGRLRPDGLSGTVMTKIDPHWGPVFHYEQNRTLTVREAARLQSFPDKYVFSGPKVSQYEQVGNAVPVYMARAIGESILRSLGYLADN
jgi:DNA (cytosine-5)-methyltransferase 1